MVIIPFNLCENIKWKLDNIKDMYNNDVGKGGAWVNEAFEVK